MALDEMIKTTEEIAEYLKDYKRLISQLPTTAYWRKVDANGYACSNCNRIFSIVPKDNSIGEYKYCPNCKTRMTIFVEKEEQI